MKRTVFLYAIALGALVLLLKLIEYRFLIRDLQLEAYLGLIAVMFTALGIWAGYKLTRPRMKPAQIENFPGDLVKLEELGISKREHQMLQHIAMGLSNQEIADKLSLSPNTVKSHISSVFVKLDVSRRTQAIRRAKELGLLP